MISHEEKWSPSYGEPLEKPISWSGSLGLLDVSRRSLVLTTPDEKPDSPALFLTKDGLLYLRVCWGGYYVLSSQLEEETFAMLKNTRCIELTLINNERKVDISCALYHVKELPGLISDTLSAEAEETTEDGPVFNPKFPQEGEAEKEPIDLESIFGSPGTDESPTISDEEFDKILSIELPEVEYEPLTLEQVAKTLSLNTMWKVDDIHYLFRSGQQLFLCALFDEKGQWLADEEPFRGEPPLWFSSDSHCESPVSVLLRLCKDISRRHSLRIVPLLICGEGCTIINESDMKADWVKLEVGVCNVTSALGSELPTLEQAVKALEKNALIGGSDSLPGDALCGYEELHFDSQESIAEEKPDFTETLCRFMNVEGPLAQKANYSLWYTPGHLFLIYACNSLQSGSSGTNKSIWSGGRVTPPSRLMIMADCMESMANVKIHRVMLMNKDDRSGKLYGKILYENVLIGRFGGGSLPQEEPLSLSDIITTCRAADDYLSTPSESVLAMLKDVIDGIPDNEDES